MNIAVYKRVLVFALSILLFSSPCLYSAEIGKKYTGPLLDGCSIYQLGMDEFVITFTGKKLPQPQANTDNNSLAVFFNGAKAKNPKAINSSISDIIEGIPVLYNFEAENISDDKIAIQLDAAMPLEILTASRTAKGWSFRVKAHESQKLPDVFPVLTSPKTTAAAPQTKLPFTADIRTTIEFRDAELQDVFRLFMAALGRNIVIDSSFPKNTLVTMTLVDVRIDEIMNYLLRTYDIACYSYAPNITAFGTSESLYKLSGAKELKTFKISYASPQRIGEILKNLLGFSVTLIRENAGNASGSNTGVNTTSSTTTGSSVSARAAQNAGRNTSSGSSSNTAGNNTVSEIMIDERFRMLYVKTNPARMQEVEEMIKLLDVPLRQVMIRASIFEFSDEATSDVQSTLNMVYDRWSLESNLALDIGTISYQDRTYRNGRSDFDRYITASFSALEAKNKGKIIANPSVITIEGEEAKITLKQDIMYSAGRDDSGNPTWKTTEVGPELTFTPIIEDKGYINLTIKINTGDYLGTDSDGNIQTTDRDIETHIRVRDGMPFVVGGLFQDITTKYKSKIPILGDIPLLGRFFSYTSDLNSKTQAVMIVTPYILDSR